MITVLQPGMFSTVQDEGRQEFLSCGLPRAGIMDRYAARMANLLCSNPLGAAVIEMTLTGGAFRVEKACRLAICGANMNAHLNGKLLAPWAAADVVPGDILETGVAEDGCRAYLALSGGIDVPVVMGSRATYTRASVGGFKGRALKTGDQVPLGDSPPLPTAPSRIDPSFRPQYADKIILRVLLGPQDDLFTAEGIETFLQSEYSVSEEADRMGYRLSGPHIVHRDKADIVSDGLGAGAVQVPGSGQPIVMMADCGTTGGYAKIATVISADLYRVAQAKPQDTIRFSLCTEAEAIQALAEERNRYHTVAKQVALGPTLIGAAENITTSTKTLRLRIMQQEFKIEIEEVK